MATQTLDTNSVQVDIHVPEPTSANINIALESDDVSLLFSIVTDRYCYK
jgi:hypothetical protein